ncbi:Fic family protein [Nitrospirillum sp. BR 11828]|uniref:Fic family protein n=1 Tax=Nitrospirillum sp. BR 11828 TaxID=3104325 RepID=UPI002ACAF6C1|nr:Fic family protein [Nitrospirillum sp. BR 11828]MDZ5645848.1 Fic family protein [Nitrospirillum sp. BR 11828]
MGQTQPPSRLFHVPLMPIPYFDALPQECRQAYIALDRRLDGISAKGRARLLMQARDPLLRDRLHNADATHLRHKLSEHFTALNADHYEASRIDQEINALTRLWPGGGTADQSFASGVTGIREALRLRTTYRDGPCHSRKDLGGYQVLFPGVAHIPERLRAMDDFVAANLGRSRSFTATVAMNAICNLHPFQNGNGRTSRVLFNLLIGNPQLPPLYVPLYALSKISHGGFLIRLRQAQYHNDWHPLADFIASGLDLLCSVQTSELAL